MFNYKSEEAMIRLRRASDLAYEFNHNKLSRQEQFKFLNNWLHSIGDNSLIKAPFNCDFGDNISIGNNTVVNLNCIIFDRATVSIGNNVLIGPNCSLYTSIHPIDYPTRNANMMIAESIVIEDNVWLGGNVVVMPGVTIKSGSVVGAGSVVTKDVELNTLVAGNPAKVIKDIDQDEVDPRFI